MKNPFTFLWSNITPEYIDVVEMNKILKFIKDNNFKEKPYKNVCDGITNINKYSFKETKSYIEVRYTENLDVHKRFIVKKILEEDSLKATSGITGMEAFEYVEDLFQKTKNTNITLYRAFSGSKYRDVYKSIKRCVPKQIGYITPYNAEHVIKGKCFKADVSSAFPSQMTKSLPTLHDYIKYEGRVEPTKEYPFAFYIKSGHIKIYNELDTRNMNNDYYSFYKDVYDDTVEENDDITILCKESEYSLKDEFEYMYSQRKKDINQKMYMNACIGFFHRNGDPRLAHIAAVVIARNNNEMMNRVLQLDADNNGILYIATDCVVWRGKESDIATDDKYLGSFTYEGRNGSFYGVMVGAYQFLDENGLITKCSYLKNDINKQEIPFGKLPAPKNGLRYITIGDKNSGRMIISII